MWTGFFGPTRRGYAAAADSSPGLCASDAQSSASLSPTIETPPAVSGKEEYLPDADELDLHPPFDFSRGIDCKTLTEVSPKDL